MAFWFGQLISRVGNLIYDVVLGVTIYEITGSTSATAMVLSCFTLSQLIILIGAGTIVDQVSRKKLIIITDIIATIVLAFLAISLWLSIAKLWFFYIASGLLGTLSALYLPAYRAFMTEVINKEQFAFINSLNAVTNSVTRIVAPAIGSMVIALFSVNLAFMIDSLTFLVAILCTIPLKPKMRLNHGKQSKSIIHEFKKGLAFIWRQPWLYNLLLFFSVINFIVIAPIAVLLPAIIVDKHLSTATIGIIAAMQGTGAVISNSLLMRYKELLCSFKLMYGLTLLFSIGVMLLGLCSSVGSFIITGIILGIAIAGNTIKQNLLQVYTPKEFLGRVFSVDMLASFAFLPIGYTLAGFLGKYVGNSRLLILSGVAGLILSAIWLLKPITHPIFYK